MLDSLREAGRIASAARALGAARVVAGARLLEVCEAVEHEIRRRGGALAFPVQTSRNDVAAHYCPAPGDETVYATGDLAKLDLGVHVDGWVVDTALTVNVGDVPQNRALVGAASRALEAAIAIAHAGVPVRVLSAAIEQTIRDAGLSPVRNLCGHGVGRYVVHCPPAIPNVAGHGQDILQAGAVVAIEPFATDGLGHVTEEGVPEIFRLDPASSSTGAPHGDVVEAIRALSGLPFARRQLAGFDRASIDETLVWLRRHARLTAYPPLQQQGGRPVAQAEHTIYVGADGVEVLTR